MRLPHRSVHSKSVPHILHASENPGISSELPPVGPGGETVTPNHDPALAGVNDLKSRYEINHGRSSDSADVRRRRDHGESSQTNGSDRWPAGTDAADQNKGTDAAGPDVDPGADSRPVDGSDRHPPKER
jgi:hypothetical protein